MEGGGSLWWAQEDRGASWVPGRGGRAEALRPAGRGGPTEDRPLSTAQLQ